MTVGDTVASLCASARPCWGWIGVYVTVDGEVWLDTCSEAHIDHFEDTPCAVMRLLWPGVPGIIDIGWDGDTAIDGYSVLECPPFYV
ncbi:MAG TPA: hypothetical protein VNA20_15635 [Frankiaceae bacterium]|nr:hypothetical protein [Frankiaceae bacterium]